MVIISIPAKAQTSPYTKVHKASILQKTNKQRELSVKALEVYF